MKKKISMLMACAMTVNCMSLGMNAFASSFTDDNVSVLLEDPTEASEDEDTEEEDPDDLDLEDLEDARPYEELISGTWVNEYGFLCIIDTLSNTFIDSYGTEYRLVNVLDHGLIICETANTLRFDSERLPVHGAMYVACELNDNGGLIMGNRTAVKLEDRSGQMIAEDIRDLLAGNSFTMGTGEDLLTFSDDMTTVTNALLDGEDQTQSIAFDGISIHFLDESDLTGYFRVYDGNVVMAYLGTLYPLTGEDTFIPGEWVRITDGGEVSIFDDTDPSAPCVIDPLTEESEDWLMDVPVFVSEDGTGCISFFGDYVGGLAGSGVFAMPDTLMTGANLIVNSDSPYAENIVRRYITLANDPGEAAEYNDLFGDGYLTYELYDNEWPSDIVYATQVPSLNGYYDEDITIIPLSAPVLITNPGEDAREITLTFVSEELLDLDFSLSDNVAIYKLPLYQDEEIRQMETNISWEGTADCTIDGSGLYVLADVCSAPQLTPENYFDVDPSDTAWGMSDLAGDIPSLVDLDYIEESMDGVFYVSNAEELASVTYFINTYPSIDAVMIDLIDDIDLTGYEWAPIGAAPEMFGAYNYFTGIFCGNGHVISGLTMNNDYGNNAFFGYMWNATVIGLNIEDAYIRGTNSFLMAYKPSATVFADCYAEGSLPDVTGEEAGYNRFGIFYPMYGNVYMDCSYDVVTFEDLTGEDVNLIYDSSVTDSFVISAFTSGDGTYDYSEDFFLDGYGAIFDN